MLRAGSKAGPAEIYIIYIYIIYIISTHEGVEGRLEGGAGDGQHVVEALQRQVRHLRV